MTGFDWIAPLEAFVRTAHQNKVPMVGVCFGHQLIAQALGGIARKSEKGFGLGRHVYDIAPNNGVIEGTRIALACSHQDQVITPPAGATNDPVLGFHAACRAALCRRHHALGAGTPGIHYRLRAGLLRDGAQQGRCARQRGDIGGSLACRTAGERAARRRDRALPHPLVLEQPPTPPSPPASTGRPAAAPPSG